jgi:hypothetical protein
MLVIKPKICTKEKSGTMAFSSDLLSPINSNTVLIERGSCTGPVMQEAATGASASLLSLVSREHARHHNHNHNIVGMGVIKLEKMFNLTLGANIETTVTAIVAAMVSEKIEALQVSLSHLLFNITGVLVWYPILFSPRIPLGMSQTLGKDNCWWCGLPAFMCVFILPIILLGISYLFTTGSAGFTALKTIIVVWPRHCVLCALVELEGGKDPNQALFPQARDPTQVK